MAYKPVDRSFPADYLQEQHNVMRWLYENGLTAREIRQLTIGNLDESYREVKVTREHLEARYFTGLGGAYIDKWDEEVRISARGSGYVHFLFVSKLKSCYLFTREEPKSWRKAIACDSLYSIEEVERICNCEEIINRNVLTLPSKSATMKVSKLNITNLKPRS